MVLLFELAVKLELELLPLKFAFPFKSLLVLFVLLLFKEFVAFAMLLLLLILMPFVLLFRVELLNEFVVAVELIELWWFKLDELFAGDEDEQQSPIDLSKSSSSFRRHAKRPTLG